MSKPINELNKIFTSDAYVIHISVSHDHFYNFSSGVITVENKEKKTFFAAYFHVFRPRFLTPFDLHHKFVSDERPNKVKQLLKTALLVLILEKLA